LSCDFAVWYPYKEPTNVEAEALYKQLCDGRSNLVTPHPAIEDFYREITSLHPEINDVPGDEIDNVELCPWSTEFDKSHDPQLDIYIPPLIKSC